MKHRLLNAWLLIAIAIFTACSEDDLQDSSVMDEPKFKTNISFIEQSIDHQKEAVDSYREMLTSFGQTKTKSMASGEYPDYYGGSYINEDGKLVVFVLGDIHKGKAKLNSITSNDEIITKPADYSFNLLNAVMDTIDAFKLNEANKQYCTNFNWWAIQDDQNRVVVALEDFSDEAIKEFKNHVSNSPAIVFKKSTGGHEEQASVNVNPGAYVYSPTDEMSIGYRAANNYYEGVVTAAHGIEQYKDLLMNGKVFAQCTKRNRGGEVDAAWCPITDENYLPTNYIGGDKSKILSTQTDQPGKGTVINMHGQINQSTGVITNTRASVTYKSGYSYTNITDATYASDKGDSGAIVYSYVSSTGYRYTLGIHQGASTDGKTAHFCKADLINQKLGIFRY